MDAALFAKHGSSFQYSYSAQNTTIYYLDKLMEIEASVSNADYRHYITDVAILTKTGDLNDTTPGINYLHRDRLGSVVNISDASGLIEEGRGYDAFGKPRNGDWTDKTPPVIGSNITDRGFTDHEHLDDHQLIHMNGRGYDYGLGRFLSVDPFIQAPGNSQSINGYSYIMNNPLAGVDPTGYCSAETGTRIKSCGDLLVEVKDSETGEVISSTIVTDVNFSSRGQSNGAFRSGVASQFGDTRSKGSGQVNDIDALGSHSKTNGTTRVTADYDDSGTTKRIELPKGQKREDLSADEDTYLSMLNLSIQDYLLKISKAEDSEAIMEFDRTRWFYDPEFFSRLDTGVIARAGHTFEDGFSFYTGEENENAVVFNDVGVSTFVSNPNRRRMRYHGHYFAPGFYGLKQIVAHEAGHTIRSNVFKWGEDSNTWHPIRGIKRREDLASEHAKKYYPDPKDE